MGWIRDRLRCGVKGYGRFLLCPERMRWRPANPFLNMKPIDFVGAWTYALEHFLKSFLEVTFPWIAVLIDWRVPHVSLDKELQEIMPEAQPDPERFDKLIRFRLISGKDACLWIHFEFSN